MSIYISKSSLNDFILCHRKVYYRIFTDLRPTPPKEVIRGSIVHKILEKFSGSLDEAKTNVEKLAKQYSLDKKDFDYIMTCVSNFSEFFLPLLSNNDLIEHNFKVPYADDVYIVGVFDRVSSGNVFDWKTSSRVPRSINTDIQFILYNYAYKNLFNTPANALYYASLATGRLLMYNEEKFIVDELFNKIIPHFLDVVKRKNFARTGIFSGGCYRCFWKESCLGY